MKLAEEFLKIHQKTIYMDDFQKICKIFSTEYKHDIKRMLCPYVLKYYSFDTIINDKKQTIIHYFGEKEKYERIPTIIKYFMSVNHIDDNGNNPLHVCYNDPKSFIELYNNGCDTMLKNNDIYTPYKLLIEKSSFETFSKIVEQIPTDVCMNLYYITDLCIDYHRENHIKLLVSKYLDQMRDIFSPNYYHSLFNKLLTTNWLKPILYSTNNYGFFDTNSIKYIIKSLKKGDLFDKYVGLRINYSAEQLVGLSAPIPDLFNLLKKAIIDNPSSRIDDYDLAKRKNVEFLLNHENFIHIAARLKIPLLKKILTPENVNSYNYEHPIYCCFQNKDIMDALKCFLDLMPKFDALDRNGNDLMHNSINVDEIISIEDNLNYIFQKSKINFQKDIEYAVECGKLDVLKFLLNKADCTLNFRQIIQKFNLEKSTLEQLQIITEKDPNWDVMKYLELSFQKNNEFLITNLISSFLFSFETENLDKQNIFHLIGKYCSVELASKIFKALIQKYTIEKDENIFYHSDKTDEFWKENMNLLFEKDSYDMMPIDYFMKYKTQEILEKIENLSIPVFHAPNHSVLDAFLSRTKIVDAVFRKKPLVYWYSETIETDDELLKCLKLLNDFGCDFNKICKSDKKYAIDVVTKRKFSSCIDYLCQHGSLAVKAEEKKKHAIIITNKDYNPENKFSTDEKSGYFTPVTYSNLQHYHENIMDNKDHELPYYIIEKGNNVVEIYNCLVFLENKGYDFHGKYPDHRYNTLYDLAKSHGHKIIMNFLKETERTQKFLCLNNELKKTLLSDLSEISETLKDPIMSNLPRNVRMNVNKFCCLLRCNLQMIKVFIFRLDENTNICPLFTHLLQYYDCFLEAGGALRKIATSEPKSDYQKKVGELEYHLSNSHSKRTRTFSPLYKKSIDDESFQQANSMIDEFDKKYYQVFSRIINFHRYQNYKIVRVENCLIPDMNTIDLLYFKADNTQCVLIDETFIYKGVIISNNVLRLFDNNNVLRLFDNNEGYSIIFDKYYPKEDCKVEIKGEYRNPKGLKVTYVSKAEQHQDLVIFDGEGNPNDQDNFTSLNYYDRMIHTSILFT